MEGDKFECDECSKVLSSKRCLERHKNKSLPCDLKCRLCSIKHPHRHAYYKHMREKHPVEWKAKNEQRASKKRPRDEKVDLKEEVPVKKVSIDGGIGIFEAGLMLMDGKPLPIEILGGCNIKVERDRFSNKITAVNFRMTRWTLEHLRKTAEELEESDE